MAAGFKKNKFRVGPYRIAYSYQIGKNVFPERREIFFSESNEHVSSNGNFCFQGLAKIHLHFNCRKWYIAGNLTRVVANLKSTNQIQRNVVGSLSFWNFVEQFPLRKITL